MKQIDWLELWRELVTRNLQPQPQGLVERYRTQKREGKERPDPLLDFILKNVDGSFTSIDIGSGTGRWTIPLAKTMKSVTAIEPTSGLADMLRENLDNAGLHNVNILPHPWEDAALPVHDMALCAHGMYNSPDFAAFVRKMERFSRKGCYLAIRLPPTSGVMAELSLEIYGCQHDSVNAVVAYNALHAMGIYANVLVEKHMVNWVNRTQEDAFERAKRHLCLDAAETAHDDLIHSALNRRLSLSDGVYVWPDGMRTALLWWSPDHKED